MRCKVKLSESILQDALGYQMFSSIQEERIKKVGTVPIFFMLFAMGSMYDL